MLLLVAFLLLATTALALALAAFAARRHTVPGAIPFVILMAAAAVWALAYALELLVPDPATKLLCLKLEYLGIVALPPAWLAFGLAATGHPAWRARRRWWPLALVPLATLGLAWTNEGHGLIWQRVELDVTSPVPALAMRYGNWFWIHTATSYLAMGLGTLLLLSLLRHVPGRYRKPAVPMLLGVLLPWFANILYLAGRSPVPGLDLTPVAFVLTGLVLIWAVLGIRVLDVTLAVLPLARDAVIEGMPDGVLVLDDRGRLVDLNPGAERLLGRPRAAVLGRPVAAVLVGWPAIVLQARDPVAGRAELVLAGGPSTDAEPRHYDVVVSPLGEGPGGPAGHLVVVRDVTERKRAEVAQAFLAEAGHLLATSLNVEATLQQVAALAVPALADCCLIYAVQPDGALRPVAATHRNPAAADLLRAVAERFLFDPAAVTGPPAVMRTRQTEVYPEVTDAMLVAAAWDGEHLAQLRRLGPRAALVAPLVAREQVLGVLALLLTEPGRQYGPTDVALAEELARRAAVAIDNARLYEETQAALRARDTFLSIASHELRTPVTSLKGHVQRLHRRAARGRLALEQVVDTLPVLDRNIDRLELLIDDLLNVARLQQGRLPLHPQEADLGALVRDLLTRYEVQPACQLVLEGPVMAEPVPVLVDAARLEQVLTNLLDNAVKYSPTGGVIRVGVAAEGAGGCLSVQDAGIGIPPDQLETIFEPFGRARNVAEQHLPGLGLGLYVARLIVEQHGGRIWAESAGTGQGAQLHVWLPVSPAALPRVVGAVRR